MSRLVSLIASEGVSIDQFTGRVTAFNMIDNWMLPSLPARIVRFSVITLYELDKTSERFSERARLVAPSGAEVGLSEVEVELPARPAEGQMPNSHRSLHVLWGLPLQEVGDYKLVIEHDRGDGQWQERAALCITAIIQLHPFLNAQTPSVSVPATPSAGPPPGEGRSKA